MKKRQTELGFAAIADGANVSDTGEHRPGIAANTEEGILHPFIEAGMTKADIREIARKLGCEFWNKPSAACLSSRIPYGDPISEESLQMIERAEHLLEERGFVQSRVRKHGKIARIEVPKEDMPRILAFGDELVCHMQALGFAYITLDLKGYRSGSMDEAIGTENVSDGDADGR